MKQKFSNVPLGTKGSIASKQILEHSAHSWENLWEKVPLLCSCCSLLFQKCLEGTLNAWSLSPVQSHPFHKQEPNQLTSTVLTRKNFCVVHSTAFVAGSRQEMTLLQRCLSVGSSLIQDMLSALSKLTASISNVCWGCQRTQQHIFQGNHTVPASQLFWDRCSVETASLLLQGHGLKSSDGVQEVIFPVLFSTLAKRGDGHTLTPTKIIFLFLRLKKSTTGVSACKVNYTFCFYQRFT